MQSTTYYNSHRLVVIMSFDIWVLVLDTYSSTEVYTLFVLTFHCSLETYNVQLLPPISGSIMVPPHVNSDAL